MKLIKIMGHPVLVISLFLLVIIEGEHFGGFYVLYLLFGLVAGASYALIAIAGIVVMLLGYNFYKEKQLMKPILYLVGWILLLVSYVVFFGDGKNNNGETFHTRVPLITFVFFGLCSICLLINIVYLFLKVRDKSERSLKVI
jgi:hypothetical protein